jgi:hypothetical protein
MVTVQRLLLQARNDALLFPYKFSMLPYAEACLFI